MVKVFHGDDQQTHDAFQAWRRKNLDGFHMTEKSHGNFIVHYTQRRSDGIKGRGCTHQGSSSMGFGEDKGACYTSARKVCSNQLSDLYTWAREQGYSTRNCRHCDSKRDPFPSVPLLAEVSNPGELDSVAGLPEGASRTVTVNAYERNPEARRRCLEHYGARCAICEFDFAGVYGSVADGFIHVHHVRALSEIGERYEVDPIKDLRPVCPNCNAVIHLGGECRSIDEVRKLMRRANTRSASR